jgi:hypothetical protein
MDTNRHRDNVRAWRAARTAEIEAAAAPVKARGCAACGKGFPGPMMALVLDGRRVGKLKDQRPLDVVRTEIQAATPYCLVCLPA